jgi:hypothetical protein
MATRSDPPNAASTDIEQRLERLCEALRAVPKVERTQGEHQAAKLLESIDGMLGRVHSLTAMAGTGAHGQWDLVDQAAAQVLLRDLALVARDLRGVMALAAADLKAAGEAMRQLTVDRARFDRSLERDSGRR